MASSASSEISDGSRGDVRSSGPRGGGAPGGAAGGSNGGGANETEDIRSGSATDGAAAGTSHGTVKSPIESKKTSRYVQQCDEPQAERRKAAHCASRCSMDKVSISSMVSEGAGLRASSSSESHSAIPVIDSGGTVIRGLGGIGVADARGPGAATSDELPSSHEILSDANAFANVSRASLAAQASASSRRRAAERSEPCAPLWRSSCAITISPKSLGPKCSMTTNHAHTRAELREAPSSCSRCRPDGPSSQREAASEPVGPLWRRTVARPLSRCTSTKPCKKTSPGETAAPGADAHSPHAT
jgi:hypothetical protein